MVWFLVDDNLAFHDKVTKAGNAAMGAWVRAGSWSAASLTDGFIPTRIAHQIATQTQLDSLVRCGLFEAADGGYKFHDWYDRQLTKQEVETKRKRDRDRKAEQRKRKNVPLGVPPDVPQDVPPHNERGTPRGFLARGPDPNQAHPIGCYLGGGSAVGSDSPPPPCPKHPTGWNHDEPCRACAARREYEQQTAAAANQTEAAARRAAIDHCELCDHNGMRETPTGLIRCDHRTEAPW